jgi:branched-chain amino acid transport system ATP-binding protein
MFPRLRERQDQLAHTLSGGEQQMVAIARGLMARPRVLLVDEPTLGLAPLVVTEILDVLRRINREQGITVLFIEQNVELALSLAHRGYVLESGRVLLDGTADALLASGEVRRVFLGL